MAARRCSRAETGFIWLSGIAAVAGLWMVAVALGGDEGLLRVLSSPGTTATAPTLDPAQVVRHDAGTAAPMITTPRASDADRLVREQPVLTDASHAPATRVIAASDPRQQLLSTAVALRRSKPLPRGLWTPAAPSPPLRRGDQT